MFKRKAYQYFSYITIVLFLCYLPVVSYAENNSTTKQAKIKLKKRDFIAQLKEYGYSKSKAKKFFKIYSSTLQTLYESERDKYKEILNLYKQISNIPSIKRKVTKNPEIFGLIAIALSYSNRLALETIKTLRPYESQLHKVTAIYASILTPSTIHYDAKIEFTNSVLKKFQHLLPHLLELDYYKFFHLFGLSEGFISEKNRNKYIKWLEEISEKIIRSTDPAFREFYYKFALKQAFKVINELTGNDKRFSEKFDNIWFYYKQYIEFELNKIKDLPDRNEKIKNHNLIKSVFLWDYFKNYTGGTGLEILKKNGLITAIILLKPEILYDKKLRKKLEKFFKKGNKEGEAYLIFAIYNTNEKNKQNLLTALKKSKLENISLMLILLSRSKDLKSLEKKLEKYALSDEKTLNYEIEKLKKRSILGIISRIIIPEYIVKIYYGVPLNIKDYISLTIDVIYLISYLKAIGVFKFLSFGKKGVKTINTGTYVLKNLSNQLQKDANLAINIFRWAKKSSSFTSPIYRTKKFFSIIKEIALILGEDEIKTLKSIGNIVTGRASRNDIIRIGWELIQLLGGPAKLLGKVYKLIKKSKRLMKLLEKLIKLLKKYQNDKVIKITKFLSKHREKIEKSVKVSLDVYNLYKQRKKIFQSFTLLVKKLNEKDIPKSKITPEIFLKKYILRKKNKSGKKELISSLITAASAIAYTLIKYSLSKKKVFFDEKSSKIIVASKLGEFLFPEYEFVLFQAIEESGKSTGKSEELEYLSFKKIELDKNLAPNYLLLLALK